MAKAVDEKVNAVPIVAAARAKVDRALRGRITAGSNTGAWPGAWSGGIRVAIAPEDLPVAPLVKWVLHDFVGGPDTGQDEKLAWQVRFYFDGRPCAVALQKFGLRLYLDANGLGEADAASLGREIVATLKRATRVAAQAVFQPFAEVQVRSGQVTVSNQYNRLRSMYEHFREAAEDPPMPQDADFGDGIIAPHWNKRVWIEKQRFFNGVAMVNSYFSLLEHTLVLVWPFVGYEPGGDDLEAFIGHSWSGKFKTAFDVTAGEAKRVYDELREVAEEYRNTYAHGGFDKKRSSFLVHAPGGPVPANLRHIRERRLFEFFPIPAPSVATITGVFDRTDAWLRVGPARYGMSYAEAGFDLPFDRGSVLRYRDAMASPQAFDAYLASLGEMLDRMTNMDW